VPWKVQSSMSLREEFVSFASQPDANIAALCRQLGISRKTGYKWIARSKSPGESPLADRSRRPLNSPSRTCDDIEQQIVALRRKHPAWGARKLKRRLEDLGQENLPARSTVNGILVRHGLIDPDTARQHAPAQRFQREHPNELWQMDFKGHFATDAGRCHPLTILDDCSRFNVLLRACHDERLETVRSGLTDAMRRYGTPQAILADNGPPWGSFGQDGNWTRLGIWLVRRGVKVLHGRPNHPQTQGKEERFHRTLKAEAIGARSFRDVPDSQSCFDVWRDVYNLHRPHEALGLATPATRYTPSPRPFVETPPPIEYSSGDDVRKVCSKGCVWFKGQRWRVGHAFTGESVALRVSETDGLMSVFYCHQQVAKIDLRGQSGAG
jgi:transposase InsO family protein